LFLSAFNSRARSFIAAFSSALKPGVDFFAALLAVYFAGDMAILPIPG
jgi:hypothetical protein